MAVGNISGSTYVKNSAISSSPAFPPVMKQSAPRPLGRVLIVGGFDDLRQPYEQPRGESPDAIIPKQDFVNIPFDAVAHFHRMTTVDRIENEGERHLENLRHLGRVRPQDKRRRDDTDDRRDTKSRDGAIFLERAKGLDPRSRQTGFF